jgi:hypothetical protein
VRNLSQFGAALDVQSPSEFRMTLF